MKKKEIKAYDSQRDSSREHLRLLRRYLKVEHKDKKGSNLPSEWKMFETSQDVPRQGNDYDCGVFICMFAYYLSLGQDFAFDQNDISTKMARAKIGCSILEGKVL